MTPLPENTRSICLCPICGNPFIRITNKRFCSFACQQKSTESLRTRACNHCEKLFLAQYPGVKASFCSTSCRNKSRAKPYQSVICKRCVKVFHPSNHVRPRVFCSPKCQRAYLIGDCHPAWRGNRRHERGKTFKPNSRIVRQRDKVCVRCGRDETQIGQKLSVDHIVPFRWGRQFLFVDPNDLRNLIALCRGCHAKKTPIERLLLEGKVKSFIRKVSKIIPEPQLTVALEIYGLAASHNAGGKPCPPKSGPAQSVLPDRAS